MKVTSVFKRNAKAYNDGISTIVNKGSTRSSKTYSILQLLHTIASKSEKPILISVVSESMPHLKRGCIRDFISMLQGDNLWNANNWNATDKIYRVYNSAIEFFSVDTPGKVHGPRRDILYVNECNNIGYETIRQLMIRTTGTVFLDYNPVEEFWVDEHILSREEGVILIHSTYKDNEHLTLKQVQEIESNKHDTEWWNVYGLGITGSREGLCIKNWQQVESMPSEYKRRWIGIDFGFSNDPTAIVDVRLSNGELWVDEICYSKGMTNPDIYEELKSLRLSDDIGIVADSAEPKSIAEIRRLGIFVEGALKGMDSINIGISTLNRYKINVTKNSLNIIKEFRNYKWKQDNDGKYLRVPIDKFNHAVDAIRYIATTKLIVEDISL